MEYVKAKRYENLDCLRTLSCFAIIAMHIQANTNFHLSGWIWEKFIPSWTWLVYLFFILSGFAMCCGYYPKVWSSKFDLESFYFNRIRKIFPFFACCVLLAVMVDFSFASICEGFMELTLLFGLLPNNAPDVLGVCWFIGVVFLFYISFPFFCFLIKNKRRAWISLIVTLMINQLCDLYFFSEKFVTQNLTPRHTFIYVLPLFIAGGLIYLYREKISWFSTKYKWVLLCIALIFSFAFYILPSSIYSLNIFNVKAMLMYSTWICFALTEKSTLMNNKFMHFFGAISMEMYLAQMIAFRVVERSHMLNLFGDNYFSFVFAFVMVVLLLLIGIKAFTFFCTKIKPNFVGDKK